MIVGLVGVSIVSYAQYAKIIAPLPVHPSFVGFLLSFTAMIVVSLMGPCSFRETAGRDHDRAVHPQERELGKQSAGSRSQGCDKSLE